MARSPIPSWFFALVVVRRGDRFLMVEEQKYDGQWSLPGGRVEPGEGLFEAAVRETLEEAGVAVALEGLLRLDHLPAPHGTRVRAVFLGHATGDPTPKTVADEHSLGSAWLTLDEIAARPLRGADMLAFLRDVARGLPVLPLAQLGGELAL